MSEQEYRKRFLLEWQKENPEGRLYRINSGVAWVGNKKDTFIQNIKGLLKITLIKARRFFGAPEHSPDLWGYTVKNLCEIVPKVLIPSIQDVCIQYPDCKNCTDRKAIFTWIELKTKKDRIKKGQQKKIDQLNAVGGIGLIEREE